MANDATYIKFAWRVLGELSAIILAPALVALFAARALEAQSASHLKVFAVILLAFAFTAIALVYRIRFYGRVYERITKEQRLKEPTANKT